MKAKEMFEELGYEYYEDDGFTCYRKTYPNKKYVDFKEISFNRLGERMGVHEYRKNAGLTEFVEDVSPMKLNILSKKEIQAINKQVEELGWLNER